MLNQVYRILLYVQIDMRMLDEIALKVQEEELVGVETFGALMVLATVVNEVDNAILTAEPPDLIREEWDAAMQYQEETKQLIEDWVNEDLDSMGVRAATQEKLVEIDALMETVEMTLAEYYGFDQNELRLNRESVVESVNEIFATPEE
jgi:transcriptional regulator of heat shock response